MPTLPTSTAIVAFACRHHRTPRPHAQAGIALITSLLFLIMLTLLALPLLRGVGLEEKIAGHTREKERAFQAAENALGYAEWWLVEHQPGEGIDCAGLPAGGPATGPTTIPVCKTALANPGTPVSWQVTTPYQPPKLIVAAGGGTNIDALGNTDINYARIPGLHIAFLGASPDNTDNFYSVTSAGYGGSDGTTAVTQSVYKLYYPSKSLNGP